MSSGSERTTSGSTARLPRPKSRTPVICGDSRRICSVERGTAEDGQRRHPHGRNGGGKIPKIGRRDKMTLQAAEGWAEWENASPTRTVIALGSAAANRGARKLQSFADGVDRTAVEHLIIRLKELPQGCLVDLHFQA